MRLLADDAGTAHVLHMAIAVGDPPVPEQKLHGPRALIADFDRIGPEKPLPLWIGFFFQIMRLDGHADAVGEAIVHGSAGSPIVARSSFAADAVAVQDQRSPALTSRAA